MTRLTFIDVARIVFDTRAHAEFLKGFHVLTGPHLEAFGLEEFALAPEISEPFLKLGGNGDAGFLNPFLGRGVIISRINRIGLIGMADLTA